MSGPHKTNLIYFECASMRDLYETLRNWQDANQKDFLSISIQQDNGNFCCIALIDPPGLVRRTQELLLPYELDMARFERKALKHIGVGVSFESSAIPREKVLAIQSKLEKCTTPEDVKAVFAEEF